MLQTNLTSAYLCIQQVSSSMLKQRWGRIVNIASVFGQMGQAGQANYSASKAGLIGLTMAMLASWDRETLLATPSLPASSKPP